MKFANNVFVFAAVVVAIIADLSSGMELKPSERSIVSFDGDPVQLDHAKQKKWTEIENDYKSQTAVANDCAGVAVTIAGGVGGAGAGALIGSAIIPGFGTILGKYNMKMHMPYVPYLQLYIQRNVYEQQLIILF